MLPRGTKKGEEFRSIPLGPKGGVQLVPVLLWKILRSLLLCTVALQRCTLVSRASLSDLPLVHFQRKEGTLFEFPACAFLDLIITISLNIHRLGVFYSVEK